MKKISYLILIISCFLILPSALNAAYEAEINDTSVRIRSGAGTNNSILYTVSTGTPISVVDKTLYSGTGCNAKWYKVTYKNKTGYVCSSYVTFVNTSYSGINTSDYTARINSNNTNVRSGASTSKTLQDTLSLGVNVKILSQTTANNSGCSGNVWYRVSYYNNKTGYVCAKYITKKSDITATNSEYAQTLKNAGFPDSYIPYLTHLHNKYPNWSFVAKNTNSNFATAVDAEEGKNYMQTTNNNYRTSTTPAEGSSWFRVNKAVIAFYMDPRNWLVEDRMFMFEKLDFDASFDSKYPSLIKTVFGNGKLSADQYTNPMYTYGKKYGISPLHLASRIRLEVGANGSDSTNGCSFTYEGKTYSGYYNFFNIGAYEQTINGHKYSSITMGLVTAMNKGWNTIDKAIEGGAAFLANGYINQGQGTLYYQKFNVRPGSTYSSYTHQYMTNIQAPVTEGNQTYNSYANAGIISQSFIFEIPVYNNMPSVTSLPDAGDSNNNLTSITVEGFELSPKFDSDVLTYEVYVPSTTKSVKVSSVSESVNATITGNGTYELVSQDTDVTLSVKAQTGDIKKYVITIKFIEDEQTENNTTTNTTEPTTTNTTEPTTNTTEPAVTGNNNENNTQPTVSAQSVLNNNNITVSNSNITNIKYNTSVSTILNKINKNGVSATIKNNKGQVISNTTLIGTGSTITIKTSSETKTYTFVITGDTSGDGKITILDLLQVQKHIKGDKKLSSSYLSAGDTSKDNKVTILDLLQVQKHIKGDKKL